MGSELRASSSGHGSGLAAASAERPGQSVLACFDLAAENRPGFSLLGLDYLGGELKAEYWQAPGALDTGNQPGLLWRRAGELLYLESVLPDDTRTDPAQLAEQAYRQLLAASAAHGCPRLLRAWNFLPEINRGEGDEERYRRFCLGRAAALEAAGIDAPELCAGTAIGGDDPHMRIMLLCGATPGINIENPRQVSAYHYPRIYGPRSPSFARATALVSSDGPALLMISGTASVVGHESVHGGDLDGQIEEIRLNLDALLETSAARLGRSALARFGSDSLIRVYVREATDWPRIAQRFAGIWPGVPLVGLRGDICRADLLLEVEAVTAG